MALAEAINGEIISGDSRQLYRGMTIGTGKDLAEYGSVPYHMIDIAPAGMKYNLYQYLRDANAALEDIRTRHKNPILCGGTGMYIEAFLNGLALPEVPENKPLRESLEGKSLDELTAILAAMKSLHNTTDVDTCKRAIRAIEIRQYYIDYPEQAQYTVPHPKEAVIIGVDIDRDLRRSRISDRLRARLGEGLIQEVRALLNSGIPAEDLIYYGLEYKYVTEHVIGKLSFEEMFSSLEIAIHQFAKRQMTWFRGMERRGFKINWLPATVPDEEFTAMCIRLLENYTAQTQG